MAKHRFRIFTNDRGKKNGVPMYSALKDVWADNPQTAKRACPPQFNTGIYAPAMAIHWPENTQSDDEKKWLKKYVGDPL